MDDLRNNRPMNDPYYPILKSQEEKKLEEWKNCKNDEELARKLQQLEIIESKNNKSKDENLSVSKRDELYALKLLKEEKLNEERKKMKVFDILRKMNCWREGCKRRKREKNNWKMMKCLPKK